MDKAAPIALALLLGACAEPEPELWLDLPQALAGRWSIGIREGVDPNCPGAPAVSLDFVLENEPTEPIHDQEWDQIRLRWNTIGESLFAAGISVLSDTNARIFVGVTRGDRTEDEFLIHVDDPRNGDPGTEELLAGATIEMRGDNFDGGAALWCHALVNEADEFAGDINRERPE